MPEIKIKCVECGRRFSGEAARIKTVKTCPRCKAEDAWWVRVPGPDDTQPMTPVPTSSHANAPASTSEAEIAPTNKTTPATRLQVSSSPKRTDSPSEFSLPLHSPGKTPGLNQKMIVGVGAGVLGLIVFTALVAFWIGANSGSGNDTDSKEATAMLPQAPPPSTQDKNERRSTDISTRTSRPQLAPRQTNREDPAQPDHSDEPEVQQPPPTPQPENEPAESSDSDSEVRADFEGKDKTNRVLASNVIDTFADLHSRLKVGLNYTDYTAEVGNLQVVLDRFDRKSDATPFALAIYMRLSLVLAHHKLAQATWQVTLSDKQQVIMGARLATLQKTYELEVHTLQATGEDYVFLNEALSVIWAAAGVDLGVASEIERSGIVIRPKSPDDGSTAKRDGASAEDRERSEREADDRSYQESLAAIRNATDEHRVKAARSRYSGTRHAEELDKAVQSQLDSLAWKRATVRHSLIGHTGFVLSVAFSSDGKHVLTGSQDSTARLWNAATGKKVREFKGHSDGVSSVAFSPDGKNVLTGSWDRTIRLWDAATGKEIRKLKGHSVAVSSVAFSPGGKFVAAASLESVLVIWDTATGEETRTIDCNMDRLYSVAYSPDGKYLLTCGRDMSARLWDAATGKEIRKFKGHTNEVYSVAFSPDGKFVLTGSLDNTARLWDAATGKEIRKFKGHTSFVLSVAFSSDGKYVMTGSNDYSAMIWNPVSGSLISTLEVHSECVFAVAFSHDGQFALTGSGDFTSRLWARADD